jgi:hypothetical protein
MNAKRCEICETRPIMSAAAKREHGVNLDYCEPCLTLAEWDNAHSDYGHSADINIKDIADGRASDGRATAKTRKALESIKAQMEICWVCHPELDETAAEYVERSGSSRKGIVQHVAIRAGGKDKAAQVAGQLDDSYATSISFRKGIVTLKAASASGCGVTLRWDSQGHYLYGESAALVDGKTRKCRNASEALRLMA